MAHQDRDDVKLVLDAFGKEFDYVRKSHSWYRRQEETIAVLDLQRSNYAPIYFVNVALWLIPLGPEKTPAHNKCHVVTRLSTLLPESADRLTELLDAESRVELEARSHELRGILATADGMLASCSSIAGFGSADGQELLSRSLVRAGAQEILSPYRF